MNWPTSQDYNEAIQNPATAFSDPALKRGEPVCNAIGLPVPRSGNFADVYQFKGGDGKTWALKCFTRKVSGLQDRYGKIDEHIAKAKFPFTVGFKYFAEGVRVRGEWFPVLKMEWVEGFTLNEFVRENAGKQQYLHALMQMWAKLCGRLRDGNFAHADLQHGNVLLVPGDAQNKLALRLIDYDGMWVPALAENHSGEVGHPNFQHPLRLKERLYNADVDRFPHLVIATALRGTLVGGRPLWDKFDNGDNLLFREADLRDAGKAPVFKTLWNLHDDVLCALVGKLAIASREPLRKTPWLDDVLLEGGLYLNAGEEQKVIEILGVDPHFTAVKTVGATEAAAPTEPAENPFGAFGDFQTDDDDDYDRPRARAKSKSRTSSKRARKSSSTPFLLGGGILALAVVGVIAAVTLSNKKDNDNGKTKNADTELVTDAPRPIPPNVGDRSQERKTDPPPAPKQENATPQELDHQTGVGANIEQKTPVEVVEKKGPAGVPAKEDPPATPVLPPIQYNLVLNTKTPPVAILAVPQTADLVVLPKDDVLVKRFDLLQRKFLLVSRHDEAARTVAATPDGKMIVSAGDDLMLHIWSREQGRETRTGKEHTQPIIACATSPDGKTAVTVGQDQQLCEWDLLEAKLLRKTPIPASNTVVYLPEGKAVLLGTADESAQIFDLEKGQVVRQFPGHHGPVNAVCIPFGSRIAFTGGSDATVRAWNLDTGNLVRTLEKHKGPILSLAATADGRFLTSLGSDNDVHVWKVTNLAWTGAQHSQAELKSVGISVEGERLILGSVADNSAGSGLIKFALMSNINGGFVNRPAKKNPAEVDPPGGMTEVWNVSGVVGKLHFSADGEKLMAAYPGNWVRYFAVKGNGAPTTLNNVGEAPFRQGTFLTDDRLLLWQSGAKGNQRLYVWDVAAAAKRFEITDEAVVLNDFAVARQAGQILLRQNMGGYSVFSSEDGSKLETVTLPTAVMIGSLGCSEDGECVMAHTAPNHLWLREKKGDMFRPLPDIDSVSIRHVTLRISANKKFGLQCGHNNEVRIFDLANGKLVKTLSGHSSIVTHAQFTPDSKNVVTMSDGKLRVWDVESGLEINRANLAGTVPFDVAVSPDGQYVATTTGSTLRTQLWRLSGTDAPAVVAKNPVLSVPMPPDLTTRKQDGPKSEDDPVIATSAELSDLVADCFYSTDGKKLYVATISGTVHVLDPRTLEETQKFSALDGRLVHAAVAPKGFGPTFTGKDWLFIFDDQKTVHQFDPEKGSEVNKLSFTAQLNDPNRPYNYSMFITPDAQTLLLLNRSGFHGVSWNLKQKMEIGLNPLMQDVFRTGTHGVVFSADGRYGGAFANNKILVWNGKSGSILAMIPCLLPNSMAIIPEASVVAVNGSQRAAWNILTGKEIWADKGQAFAGGIAAIPKSKRVAYTSLNELVVRDCVKGEELNRWKCPQSFASLLASADGKNLVSFGNRDRKISLWAVPAADAVKKK